MADEHIQNFCDFTAASPEQARQYLTLTDNNFEQAVELFFTNPDLGSSAAAPSQPPPSSNRDNPITIDDDDDDDAQQSSSGAAGGHSVEDDEAMARRLQEEMYGAGGGGGGAGVNDEGVRAPMARTTETLVGPGSDWRDDPSEMRAAIAEQLAARGSRRRPGPAGIFNQRDTSSIWAEDDGGDAEARRQALSRATGGASEQSTKSSHLAELFRPPFDLISRLPLPAARDEGKENSKWIIVNVQDPSIFDCQVLNRDVWKNAQIAETIKEHFIFLQYNKGDPAGGEYDRLYFSGGLSESDDNYPHIAIIDPRTGEQVKTWTGSPGPKAQDFMQDLYEFLDRYSLSMNSKNPVQAKRKEKKKDVGAMTEEEQLEMAMQASLQNGSGSGTKDEDPDALTKVQGAAANGKGKAPDAMDVDRTSDSALAAPNGPSEAETPLSPSTSRKDGPFAQISSTNPHTEPTSTDPTQTTRIQFRYSGGRLVRRFALSDPVLRIYEWLKASPFDGMEGVSFELISMGKNLIDMLDLPIAEAGLKQGTVMVEYV